MTQPTLINWLAATVSTGAAVASAVQGNAWLTLAFMVASLFCVAIARSR